jgi:putative transposase
VFTGAIRDEPIYLEDFDRTEFLRLIEETVRAFRWICHTYCEMTTHYHHLVTTPEANIAAGMQHLNSRHAEYINRRHGFRGHLFKRRYGSVVVRGESHFLTEFRYVVRNPVRAGICSEAEQWPWCSYRATLGLVPKPIFLTIDPTLELFSHSRREARRQLRAFVNDARNDERAA